MPARTSEATWEGNLARGKGTMKVGSGLFEGPYTNASRFQQGEGSNPEELIGAAHAGCYSMYLAAILAADEFEPIRVHTTAKVHVDRVDGAPTIHTIELNTEAEVRGISQEQFQEYALRAKAECPVSKALAAVNTVELSATLTG